MKILKRAFKYVIIGIMLGVMVVPFECTFTRTCEGAEGCGCLCKDVVEGGRALLSML